MRVVLLLSILATAASASSEHDDLASLLIEKMPPYLHKKDMERVIKAAQSNYYVKHIDEARNVKSLMKSSDFTKMLAEYDDGKAENDDETCRDSVLKLTLEFYLGRSYALYMNDAGGKEESGGYTGNYRWMGRYYECLGQTDGKKIVGDMFMFVLSSEPNSTDGLWFAACLPDICTSEEIQKIYEPLYEDDTYLTVLNALREPLDALDIVAIVIFSLLGLFVLIGTCAEVYISRKQDTVPAAQTVLQRVAISFSIIKNTRTLLNTERKPGNISVLDGIRVLSMAWVILGHTLLFAASFMDNLSDFSKFYLNHIGMLGIINGTLSVDSFFFLSGLLVVYLGLKQYSKTQRMNVGKMYLYRYLRLTPPMALVMLFAVSLATHVGNGPLYQSAMQSFTPPCQKYWWTNFLYISNLYPADLEDQCIGWTWYLSNDMQFYLLSPIFIILLYREPKVGLSLLGFLILVNAAVTGVLAKVYELWTDTYYYSVLSRLAILIFAPKTPFSIVEGEESAELAAFPTLLPPMPTTTAPTEDEDKYFDDIYAKPWCRMGVYFVGMITGYILFIKKEMKMNKIFVAVMWIFVVAVEFLVVYGFWIPINDDDFFNAPSMDLMAFYQATFRITWALGLAWLTIACTYGYGGPVKSILSFKGFIPLGRLTYCGYLVHPVLLYYMYSSLEDEVHMQINSYIYYFLAATVLTLAFAYILSMLIEAPVAELQKILFSSSRNAQRPTAQPVAAVDESVDAVIERGRESPPSYREKEGVANEIELEEGETQQKATEL